MHARNTFGINYLLSHLNGTPIQYKFLTNSVFSLALFLTELLDVGNYNIFVILIFSLLVKQTSLWYVAILETGEFDLS